MLERLLLTLVYRRWCIAICLRHGVEEMKCCVKPGDIFALVIALASITSANTMTRTYHGHLVKAHTVPMKTSSVLDELVSFTLMARYYSQMFRIPTLLLYTPITTPLCM